MTTKAHELGFELLDSDLFRRRRDPNHNSNIDLSPLKYDNVL